MDAAIRYRPALSCHRTEFSFPRPRWAIRSIWLQKTGETRMVMLKNA